MALSFVQYTGDGTNKVFNVTFQYLQQANVFVKVDDVTVTFTWLDSGRVELTNAPASGTVVELRRISDRTARVVDYQDGAVLTEAALDADSNQIFHLAQEAFDASDNTLQLDFDGLYDATSKRIKNVADPVNAQDAVTKTWAETSITSQLSTAITKATEAASSATDAQSSEDDAAASEANALSYKNAAAASVVEATEAAALAAAEVVIAAAGSSFHTNTYTGNGSTTAFTMDYEPSTKANSQVYVDGVYQNKVGYSYSGTTLTFSEAPPLNSKVEVVVARALNLVTGDAAVISYEQDGTGSVTRTISDKLQESVTVKDFGAIGDGTADDTESIQAALNTGASIVNGSGLTCKTVATLTMSNKQTLENITIINTESSSTIITATGTLGGDLTLASDRNHTDTVIQLSSTDAATLSAGDMLFISDTQDYATGVFQSEIAFVKTVVGTDITLTSTLFGAYETASAAKVNKITPLQNVGLRNVTLKGAGGNSAIQTGIEFVRCQNVRISDCRFESLDTRMVRFTRSAHCHVSNSHFRDGDRAGFGYGIAIAEGTHFVTVTNCTFEEMRHGVATGGGAGVNRYVTVTNNTFHGMKDAMLDTHEETDFVNYSGNISNHVSDNGTDDGILIGGGNAVVCNNTIQDCVRHGILVQQGVLEGMSKGGDCQVVISGNIIHNAGSGTGIAVTASTNGRQPFVGVTISGNSISNSSALGISILAKGTDMKDIAITGNTISLGSGTGAIKLESNTSNSVDGSIANFAITGNVCRLSSDSPSAGIKLTTAGGGADNGTIVGNTIYNGSNGITLGATSNVTVVGNQILSTSGGELYTSSATNATIANNG